MQHVLEAHVSDASVTGMGIAVSLNAVRVSAFAADCKVPAEATASGSATAEAWWALDIFYLYHQSR